MARNTPIQRIEQLFEPAARAARRGDVAQIRHVVAQLRSLQRRILRCQPQSCEIETLRGMVLAMEGILGYVLAGTKADSRYELLHHVPQALMILHALGKRARVSALQNTTSGAALRPDNLARLLNLSSDRLIPLLQAMRQTELVELEDGVDVRITDVGIQALDVELPGWQVADLRLQRSLS